jgi:carbamoyltransferase
MATEMDFLAMGDFLFSKKEQPHYADRNYWQQKYELD